MAFFETRLGKLSIKQQSAWGTAQSSFSAVDLVEAEIAYPALTSEALSIDSIRGDHSAPTFIAGSKQGATFSIKKPLTGWTTTGSSTGADPTVHPDALLLELALGGSNRDGYSTDYSGGTTSQLTYASGSASANVIAGQAVLVPISGGTSVGWIKTVTDGSGSAHTADLADVVSATPAATTLQGSNTIFLSNDQPLPFTLQWLGANAVAAVRFSDCVVSSAKITCTPGQQPILEAEIIAGAWTVDGSGGAPGANATAYTQLAAVTGGNGGRFRIGGGAAPSASIEVSIDNTVAPVLSHAGSEGLSQFLITQRSVTMTGTFFPDSTVFAAQLAQGPGSSLGTMQFDLANGVGASFSMICPSVVCTEQRNIEDSEGIIALSFTGAPAVYIGDSASTDAGNSSFRIAFL